MKPIFELIDQGGPTIIAIMALAVVLYSRCFMLFLALRRTSRKPFEAAAPSASNVRRMQHDILSA